MKPREREETGEQELFPLAARPDHRHEPCDGVEAGASDRLGIPGAGLCGRPPLPTRLMAGLAILKHCHDLSDEALCERWIENRINSTSAARSSFSISSPSTALH